MTTEKAMARNITRAQAIEFYVWLSSYRDARDQLDGRMTAAFLSNPKTVGTYDKLLERFLAAFPEPDGIPEDPFECVYARLDKGPDEQLFAEFVRWLEPLGTKKPDEKVDDERAPYCWAWFVTRCLLKGGRAYSTSAAEREGV